MRAFALALVVAATSSTALAQGPGVAIWGQGPRETLAPSVPGNAREVAENAIKHGLAEPGSAKFRDVRASEVAQARQGPFTDPVQGPVSIVCGEVSSQGGKGDASPYAWFFVAIKHGHVLWSNTDGASGPGDAYYSCKGAGLASQG